MRGFYIPLDTNTISFDVLIVSTDGVTVERTFNGNTFDYETLFNIANLGWGSKVYYSQITVKQNGKLHKGSSVGYIVWNRNTNPKAIQYVKQKGAEG